MSRLARFAAPMAFALALLAAPPSGAQAPLAAGETAAIAEEAFVYGFPMVMNYAVFHQYFVDTASPEYKAPFNTLYNTARVYTPKDTAIVTPNSDTPYSFVGMDLRAEPFVICNPEIEKGRYFSVQLVDLYTFNFGYLGSRTTGNGAACHMITGPGWKGEKPAGIASVIPSETDFALALIRTQLFDAADLVNVKKIQAGYRGETLSKFLGKPAPASAPKIDWPAIDPKRAAADPFAYLAFLLQFAPPTGPAAVEVPLRARFARIGVEAGKPFPPVALTPAQKEELAAGAKAGMGQIDQQLATFGTAENGWRISRIDLGRKALAGDWAMRASVAKAGIYANDAVEAMYPLLTADATGHKPDGSTGRYTLTFPAGQLPPANAFWSVTMYDARTQLLVDNPIDRYLINSPMLPGMTKNADGSLTLHIQKNSPGAGKEANWLPAPDGPIYLVMRVYWPKEAALQGEWKPPAVERVP